MLAPVLHQWLHWCTGCLQSMLNIRSLEACQNESIDWQHPLKKASGVLRFVCPWMEVVVEPWSLSHVSLWESSELLWFFCLRIVLKTSNQHLRSSWFSTVQSVSTNSSVTMSQSTPTIARTVGRETTNCRWIQKTDATEMPKTTKILSKAMLISKCTSAEESARTKDRWRRALE